MRTGIDKVCGTELFSDSVSGDIAPKAQQDNPGTCVSGIYGISDARAHYDGICSDLHEKFRINTC
jgi:hypothetical protein